MSQSDSLIQEFRHSVSFYDDSSNKQINLQPMRELAKYFLSEGYGVVYGVEEFHKDDKESTILIVKKIVEAKGDLNSNFDKNDFQGSDKVVAATNKLMIIDPNSMYADNNKPSDIINYWSSQYSEAAERFGLENDNVKGILGINIPDPYFDREQFEKFLEFEEGINKEFNGKVGLLCWYKKKWLEELSLPQFIKMMGTHGNVINDNLSIVKWDVDKILNIITETIDSEHDSGNKIKKDDKKDDSQDNHAYSNLLFEAIRNRYNLDRGSVITKPDKFEEILTKMLGKDSYEELSKNIKYNFIKEIFVSSNNLASPQI